MHKKFPIPSPSVRAMLAATTVLCGLASQPALADCVADASGINVSCTGTSPTYVNSTSGVTLNADSTAVVTGPVVLGTNATVTNAGSIAAGTTGFAIQAGAGSSVTNSGTITSTSTATTSGGISLGDNSIVTNDGTFTAATGTDAALFAANGTFINNADVTGGLSGNIAYGLNLGANVATFKNYDTTFGYTGTVSASGNMSVYNDGLFTGTISQTATLGSVSIVNDTAGIYSGVISTGDATTLTNNGKMTLDGYSAIGTLQGAGTSFTNNGTLSIGASGSVSRAVVYGGFNQGASGTLNVSILSSTTGAPVAGTSYSQVEALGANGTATLAGTLNVVPAAGFYPTGSTYDVVVADQGITGGFSSVTGNTLTFISFDPVGVVQLANGQYAYELQAVRTQTYAQALAGVGTANQLAVATGFQPLVATATASPTSDAATLIGSVDVLSVSDAQTFFDSVSPAGYAAYADALRDQANMFQRQVTLRMSDQNSNHSENGPWLTAGQQFHVGSTTGDETSQSITQIQGGYDWSGPSYVVGGSIGYSSDHLKYAPGSMSGHNSETSVGAYGAYRFGPLVASAQVGYTFGSLSASKTITIGTAIRTASASARNHLLTAQGTLGFDLKAGGLELSPYGGVAYAKGSISAFTETGANTADLSVARIDASRTDLLAGATITTSGGKWRPYLRATYRSEIGSDKGGTIDAYFNGDSTTAFTVTTPTASKSEVDVDAGVNVVFLDEGSLYFGYQGTIRSDMTSHGIMAGIRLEF